MNEVTHILSACDDCAYIITHGDDNLDPAFQDDYDRCVATVGSIGGEHLVQDDWDSGSYSECSYCDAVVMSAATVNVHGGRD